MAQLNTNSFLTKQYKRYLATCNLPTGKSSTDYSIDSLRVRMNASYIVAQWELAPTTRQEHLQLYWEVPKKVLGNRALKLLRKWLQNDPWIRPAKGTSAQNYEYCSKTDSRKPGTEPFEFGEPMHQGARTDLDGLVEMIKDGCGDQKMIEANPKAFCQYAKGLTLVRGIYAKPRDAPSQLVFLWGRTGLGKTAQAMKLSPQPVRYRDPFIIGYNPSNPVVLFDDFNWKKMDVKYWLTLCDRYAMTVEVKGGHVNWAPTTIVFTSNDDPLEWWPAAPEDTRAAVHRRMAEFGETRQFGELVPHTQTLLTRYLQQPSAQSARASASSGAGSSTGSKRGTPATPIIQLDSDDEQPQAYSDSDASEFSQQRRQRMRRDEAFLAKGKGPAA